MNKIGTLTRYFSLYFFVLTVAFSCTPDGSGDTPNEGTVLVRRKMAVPETIADYKLGPGDILNGIEYSGGVKEKFEFSPSGNLAKVTETGLSFNAATQTMDTVIVLYNTYTYGANGRISRRDIWPGTHPVGHRIYLYTYNIAGQLTGDTLFYDVADPVHMLGYTTYQYTGDNITGASIYELNGTTMELSYQLKTEYDNKNNPLLKHPVLYYVLLQGDMPVISSCMSKNNPVVVYRKNPGGDWARHSEYTYQYNSSGYPWKQNATYYQPAPFTENWENFYKQ